MHGLEYWYHLMVPFQVGDPSLFELFPPRSPLQSRILHPRDFIFECLVSQAIQIFCHAEDPIAEMEP